MKTLLDIIERSTTFLDSHGVNQARRQAEEVIADALEVKRIDLYLQFERPLTETELASCRDVIVRRAKHEPTAYIAGRVDFAGVCLKVTPDVLIPRPETEILVEKIAKEPLEGVLFDICCGSGAIGIALQKRFPDLKVYMSDLSPEAVAIARENSEGIEVFEGDLLEPFGELKPDYIVCNPPYVTASEYEQLDPEVKWEPKSALVSGETGLEFYERLAQELDCKKGWLEIGTGQGEAVQQIFEKAGWQAHYEADWSGHDRFLTIEKSL